LTKNILIIGGGPAGLTAAKSLVDGGAEVTLVEKSESLGGMSRELTCKGVTECRNCGACLATDRAVDALREPGVEVLLLSEVSSVARNPEGYEAKIKVGARYVNSNCTGCGKCVEVCPVDGKAIFPVKGSGRPRTYWIDRSKCQHFKKARCDKCSSVCPTGAIVFDDRARNVTRKVSAIVYATGMEPVDACEVSRLGCGTLDDVISSVDAERILNEKGRLARPSDGATPKKVAVVQCVGSRSVKNGVDYCSKFCCKYATKIAQLLFELDPELLLDFYFMDLRTMYEPQDDFKVWVKSNKKNVRLMRTMPATVQMGQDSKLVMRSTDETDGGIVEEQYDLVILSVGMRPVGASTELAQSLGIISDDRGFATTDDGSQAGSVHILGAISSPMDIEESAVRAIATSSRIQRKKEAVQ